MAMATASSASPDKETVTTLEDVDASPLPEFRRMVGEVCKSNTSEFLSNENMTAGNRPSDRAVRFLRDCDADIQANSDSQGTAVSVEEIHTPITDTLNVAAQSLSLFYDSVVTSITTEPSGEEATVLENENEEVNTGEEVKASLEQSTDQSHVQPHPNPIAAAATTDNSQQQTKQKRHIMISYNRSCIDTCQKIYDGLVKLDYKVWMDLTGMHHNILEGMAEAVENAYIVLLCINHQYFESGYCKLEAEYAAENRIKFIPCLMEASFQAKSWLGIIKGANLHIDFSVPDDFDKSFQLLIREISDVERKLALCPRLTPAPISVVNPLRAVATATAIPSATLFDHDANSCARFDAIIHEYQKSIKKRRHHLNRLKRNELSQLIGQLRQELFSETSQILSNSDTSDEDNKKEDDDEKQLVQRLLTQSLDQNELLLRLVDRLSTPPPTQQQQQRTHLDMDAFIKLVLTIMLLWTLNTLFNKKE